MRLRIIDYVGNAGGGVRFTLQLLRAFAGRPGVTMTLVSHGEALDRYQGLLGSERIDCPTIEIPPVPDRWSLGIPPEALEDCEQVWLPWMHRHACPVNAGVPITASFHDAILLEFATLFADLVPAESIAQERELTERWFGSDATIAVSAHATVATLNRLFGVCRDRFQIIPISGEHARPPEEPLRADWPWAREPFLLCPANVCPHKNHETLFRGVARWGRRYPLVLTGQATHLHLCKWERSVALRRLAGELGFEMHRDLYPLGYVSDGDYYALLRHARALVMPTLAEGGGSFPVAEAIQLGIPVVCSDIPPVRDQVGRMGAKVHFFDPQDPPDLARTLEVLETSYPEQKAAAQRQVATLHCRSWSDVAEEYCKSFAGWTDNRGKVLHCSGT